MGDVVLTTNGLIWASYADGGTVTGGVFAETVNPSRVALPTVPAPAVPAPAVPVPDVPVTDVPVPEPGLPVPPPEFPVVPPVVCVLPPVVPGGALSTVATTADGVEKATPSIVAVTITSPCACLVVSVMPVMSICADSFAVLGPSVMSRTSPVAEALLFVIP